MNQTPLTIIILTHRSDERLEQAIASAQFANDVLVIANRIEHEVQSLRSKYTFQIMPWDQPITDFSQVRNEAMKHAKHDWVLFLDSDEVISPQSIPEIQRLIAENHALGYGVRRSDVFLGKQLEYGEAGNQLILRLGRKESMKFSGKVHEVADVAGKVAPSSISLLHYSHPSISEFISKVSQYAQQVASERMNQPITFSKLLFELLVYPPAKFLYSLLIQGGIADGWHGVVYAACMSLHSILVRVYLYEKVFITKS